jgi:hypothetical protein
VVRSHSGTPCVPATARPYDTNRRVPFRGGDFCGLGGRLPSTQPVSHRPTVACHTANIIPPSRMRAAGDCPWTTGWLGVLLGIGGDATCLLAGEGGLPLEVRPCCADHSW